MRLCNLTICNTEYETVRSKRTQWTKPDNPECWASERKLMLGSLCCLSSIFEICLLVCNSISCNLSSAEVLRTAATFCGRLHQSFMVGVLEPFQNCKTRTQTLLIFEPMIFRHPFVWVFKQPKDIMDIMFSPCSSRL